jgi:oxalate---CoA ligase
MDTQGKAVAAGVTGEIVIRGPNVMKEYENNPKANAEAFCDDWFRTGDQGVMDDDGNVSITGRLKEIINRGGEKISAREVDEGIMEHPAVHQCVTFGLPHDMLGEDVAAAAVLKQRASASDKELRQFAAARLADFKVPRRMLILTEIPVVRRPRPEVGSRVTIERAERNAGCSRQACEYALIRFLVLSSGIPSL